MRFGFRIKKVYVLIFFLIIAVLLVLQGNPIGLFLFAMLLLTIGEEKKSFVRHHSNNPYRGITYDYQVEEVIPDKKKDL